MSAYILSNALVYLKDILQITSGVGATFRISTDLERGLNIETGAVNAFFVLKSSTQIERFLITATGGVATIVKRGLEQDGITENANLKKSWGDGSVGYITVKPDDFIALGKLDTAGGLRNTMGTAQNIGATNGSTAITVADTTGWANGASITGTGIPGGTTIVSFVPNTSAVLSANFTGTTGTVSVIVGIRYALEIDSSLNEVKKPISNGATISSIETFRKRKAGGEYEEIPYSVLQADMALAGGGSYVATPYESTIVANDPVGITSDGLFECTTENKSSINISASSVAMLGTVKLSATRTLFMYYSGLTVFAIVGTLTGDTMAFGTEVTIGTGATGGIYGGCCDIGTDKVVTVWGDGTTASANNANHTVLTISGTTITVNTTYVYSMSNIGGTVKPIQTVCKVRNDCYAWGYFNSNTGYNFINSVSGTVITINGTAFITGVMSLSSWNGVYLSDNLIGFPVGGNGVATSMNMYAVTPGAVTIATTYTGASSDGTGTATVYLARVSDTEYVATFNATNQNTVKYTKPPSGTALIVTNMVANGAVAYPVVSVGDANFGVVNGTTLSVYTRSGQLLGTITGITSPAANSLFQYFKTSNARMVYITGTNGTVRIINLARVFYLGIANNSVGGVLFRGLLTVTGIVTNQLYYVQADGTIGETFSSKLIGKGITTNTLLVG